MPSPALIAVEILRLDYPDAPQGMATRALIDADAARLCLAAMSFGIASFTTGEIAQWVAQIWGTAYQAEPSQIIDCFTVQDTPELGCASFLLVSHPTLEQDLEAAARAESYLKSRFGSAVAFESNGARADGQSHSLADWAGLNAERLTEGAGGRRQAVQAFSERSRPAPQQSPHSAAFRAATAASPAAPAKPLTPDMIAHGA